MCVHLCNCRFNILILLVSLDFKTSWKMFTQRGGVCNWCKFYDHENVVFNYRLYGRLSSMTGCKGIKFNCLFIVGFPNNHGVMSAFDIAGFFHQPTVLAPK